jgi:hypothetical protein
MRNPELLSKRLLCVIVRRCVYTMKFSALQTKHLILSMQGHPSYQTTSTHLRTITHDSMRDTRDTWTFHPEMKRNETLKWKGETRNESMAQFRIAPPA